MANTGDWDAVNGNMTLGFRASSMRVINVLMNSAVALGALMIAMGTKPDSIYDIGNPSTDSIFAGDLISPAEQRTILECDQYNPFELATYQNDIQASTVRGTHPKVSTGGAGTLTATITLGVITGVGVTSSADFAGAPPTIIVQDPVGGGGAVLRPIMSTTDASIASIQVLSGGANYSAATTAIVQTNQSAGTVYQRPTFRWTEYEATGIIYDHDRDRAQRMAQGNSDIFNSQINNLATDQIKMKTAGMITRMEEDAHFGLPTNATQSTLASAQSLWDQQYGFANILKTDNVYAGVDRTVAANAYWLPKVDTASHNFSLSQLWQDTHVTKNVMNNGGKVDLYLVGPTLFAKWQQESLAYTQNVNTDPNIQIMKSKYGFLEGGVLRFSNSWVVLDKFVPANTVYGLNSSTFCIAFKSGEKWKASQMYDQAAVEGGKKASIFYITTQYMFMCVSPGFGNIKYTAIS